MFILKNLNPSRRYRFNPSVSDKTLPMTVKEFLSGGYDKELIAIDGIVDSEIHTIWTASDGWNAQAYSDHVDEIVSLIDKSQVVNPEFIDSAINDGLSIFDAVTSWFGGTEIFVEIELHLAGTSGLLDIDISGVGSVRRCVLSMNIQKSDMFNIYYDTSSKGGGVWDTDLKTTLANYFDL